MVDEPVLVPRALTVADAAAVLALVHEAERESYGEPLTDLEDVLAGWQVPAVDLGRDSLGVWHGERLVARAELTPRARIEVAVSAGWRYQGLEVELLDVLEARARARGLTAVDQFLAEGDRAGLDRVRQRGYHEHHTAWLLRLEPDVPVARRELPAGYAVRPFRPVDAAAAFTVIAEAFAEWDTAPPRSFADWEARSLRRPGVDPANSRVATHRGVVVAVCIVHDGSDETWVAQLATHRDHRRRGLAQQLLAEAYAAGRERGRPRGGLSTDDRTGALDLYLRLGMRVRHTVHNWSLELSPAAAVPDPAGLVPPGRDR